MRDRMPARTTRAVAKREVWLIVVPLPGVVLDAGHLLDVVHLDGARAVDVGHDLVFRVPVIDAQRLRLVREQVDDGRAEEAHVGGAEPPVLRVAPVEEDFDIEVRHLLRRPELLETEQVHEPELLPEREVLLEKPKAVERVR